MGRRQVNRRSIDRSGSGSCTTGLRPRTVTPTGCRTRPPIERLGHAIGRAAVFPILAVAVFLLATALAPDTRAADRVPLPALVKAHKGEACVEPLPVIRRDHMKFLMHQRDDTVHEGIRGARHSLVGCIDCHAARDDAGQWVRIDAPGQFCASCHEYASVKIDCFECHSALPRVAFRETAE